MNVMRCTAQQPGVSLSCQCCSCEHQHCWSWKLRVWISRCVCVPLWKLWRKKFSLNAEHRCRNDACIAFVCYITLCQVVFPLSLIFFFFLPFLISAFLRGFTGNCRQINQRWEVSVHNLYFTEYLCAISQLVSYSGITSFHLKNNICSYHLLFQREYVIWQSLTVPCSV